MDSLANRKITKRIIQDVEGIFYMNIKTKKLLSILIVSTLLLVNTVSVWSATKLTSISAFLDDEIKIAINGKNNLLINEDGSQMSPIIYNNRTYLPLRSLAKFIGIDIGWDENEHTVKVTTDNKNISGISGKGMPDISPEMNSPNYWIGLHSDSNKVILDEDGIEAFNKKITTAKDTKVYDLKNYPESLTKHRLAKYINELPVPDEDRYIDENKVKKEYYNPIKQNMDIAGIKDNNSILYAFTIKRTNLRTLPVKDPSYSEPNDFEFDYFQETAVETSEPILVLYKTLDNNWFFIQTSNYRGWVDSKDIAIAKTKSEWLSFLSEKNFIVVTANKLRLSINPYTPALSELEFGMGCRLPVFTAENQPNTVDGQTSVGNVVVKVPVRNTDGLLEFKNALIPCSSDISYGYLPYTKSNIIKQAFKMLGDRYGWGGLFGSHDCSSLVCDVYKSFGINMPRNTTEQELLPCTTISFSNESYEKRAAIISNVQVGSALYMPYHTMIYLGTVGGKQYVIQSVYSYGDKNKPKPKGGLERVVVNGIVISNLDLLTRGTAKTFLEALTSAKTIK